MTDDAPNTTFGRHAPFPRNNEKRKRRQVQQVPIITMPNLAACLAPEGRSRSVSSFLPYYARDRINDTTTASGDRDGGGGRCITGVSTALSYKCGARVSELRSKGSVIFLDEIAAVSVTIS